MLERKRREDLERRVVILYRHNRPDKPGRKGCGVIGVESRRVAYKGKSIIFFVW